MARHLSSRKQAKACGMLELGRKQASWLCLLYMGPSGFMRRSLVIYTSFMVLFCALPLWTSEFNGWQSMELISLEKGRALRGVPTTSAQVFLGDINGDGADNVLVLKRRHSSLTWYSYVEEKDRAQAQHDSPNDLPLSVRFKQHELRFERLPYSVRVLSPGRIAVLVGPPNHLEIYQYHPEKEGAEQWALEQKVPLLAGDPITYLPMLHIQDQQQLLLPTIEGVQILQLGEKPQVTWMRPRNQQMPRKWFLSDLDGDGDKDLIKMFSGALDSIVWHRNEQGFRPPQSIYQQNARDAIVLERKQAGSEVVLIDSIGDALLRRYGLRQGEQQRFGHRRSLTLPTQQSPSVGVRIGDEQGLVVFDTEHPQLMLYTYGQGDWQSARTFPCVDKIEHLLAVPGQTGVILLKRKGEAELYRSEWQNGRFSFPKPWRSQEHEAKDVKLIQMGQIADRIWWTQKQDKDLVLFTWRNNEAQPSALRYPKQGAKIEHALWLGGTRLLCKDAFKRDGRLLTLQDAAVQVEQGPHLKNIKMQEYRAQLNVAQEIVPMRLHNGVMQWLDEELHATDQLMLEDGLRVADYLLLQGEEFVLEADSMQLVQLKRDASGVMRRSAQFDLPGGFGLRLDPVLGLLVQEPGWLCRLDEGAVWTLELLEHVQQGKARVVGSKGERYNRLFPVTVAGPQSPSFIATDDLKHRLNLFTSATESTTALASWKVYDDGAYPYGAPRKQAAHAEPRVVYSARIDNDAADDLVLLCHDRLVLYLSTKR